MPAAGWALFLPSPADVLPIDPYLLEDRNVKSVGVRLAKPGEKIRIIPVKQEGLIDMAGPGGEFSLFSGKLNVVLILDPVENLGKHEHEKAVRLAQKLWTKAPIALPGVEGYFPRGVRLNAPAGSAAPGGPWRCCT